eukprot:CFRG2926T1
MIQHSSNPNAAPLVHLHSFEGKTPCQMMAHCESISLTGDDNNRFSSTLFDHATSSGILKTGTTAIVMINCAAGFGLAVLARRSRYNVVAVVTDKHPVSEVAVLRAMSCEIVLGYSSTGAPSYREVAERLKRTMKGECAILDVDSLLNHVSEDTFNILADEILARSEKPLSMIVTYGHTWARVAVAIKKKQTNVKTVFVKMAENGVDVSEQVGDWYIVSARDAFLTCRQLVGDNSLMCGPNSGATVFAAIQNSKSLPNSSYCLSVMTDSIIPHTNTILNDSWMIENGFVSQKDVDTGDDKWRGAAVEDISLPLVITTTRGNTLKDVIDEMDDNDVDYVPVLNEKKRLVGLMNRHAIREALSTKKASLSDTVNTHMRTFNNSETYHAIRMDTPLADVEKFFNKQGPHADCPAFITDYNDWCLGVITKVDLLSFLSRRRV